jgi:hypothetical protein
MGLFGKRGSRARIQRYRIRPEDLDPDALRFILGQLPESVHGPWQSREGGVSNQVVHVRGASGWYTFRSAHSHAGAGNPSDLALLPEEAVYALLQDRPESVLVPSVLGRRQTASAPVWAYAYSGRPPIEGNRREHQQVATGFAEFLERMRGVPTEQWLPLQRQAIAWMGDPRRQPRPLPLAPGQPPTADLARRALLQWSFEGLDDDPTRAFLARCGLPPGPQLWRDVADGVPRGEPSTEGGGFVHGDLKPANGLVAGAFVYVIDLGQSFHSEAAPVEAACKDPIRFAHLTGNNPLLVPEAEWRPLLEPFAQRNPAFRSALEDRRWAEREIGDEARHGIAQSMFDVRRALQGHVADDVAARSVVRFQTVFGYPVSDPDQVAHALRETRTRYHRPLSRHENWRMPWQARRMRGPKNLQRAAARAWRRPETGTRLTMSALNLMGMTVETQRARVTLESREDYIPHPSGLTPASLLVSLPAYLRSAGFPDSPYYQQDWNARVIDLGHRTLDALLAGVSQPGGPVRLADPATWAEAPGMPSQAQEFIAAALADYGRRQKAAGAERGVPERTPFRAAGSVSHPGTVALAPATAARHAAVPYAGAPPGHAAPPAAHRRAIADPRVTGGCVWEPTDRGTARALNPGRATGLL